MTIPESFWGPAQAVLSALAVALVAWNTSRQTATHDKLNQIKANTDGINTRLQDTIDKQNAERIHTAEVTELKADVVQAQHEPPK